MSLSVVTGCMMAGKTEYLISLIKKESYRQTKVIVIRPIVDTRTDQLESHAGTLLEENKNIVVYKTNSAKQMLESIKPQTNEPIFVDEFQFFNKEDAEYLLKLSTKGYEVTVCGLALDSRGEDFGYMAWLMSRATDVKTLHAYCSKCGEKAWRTQRKYDMGEQVLIGGKDEYEAACFKCWRPQ